MASQFTDKTKRYKDCCWKNVMQAYYLYFFQNFFKVGFVEVKFFPTFAVPNDTLGITKKVNGEIAQLVEHRTENPCVGGSSPPFTTKNPLYATYEGFFIDGICKWGTFYKISS
jgi:hypothetical protein